jgi:hypothetical protein
VSVGVSLPPINCSASQADIIILSPCKHLVVFPLSCLVGIYLLFIFYTFFWMFFLLGWLFSNQNTMYLLKLPFLSDLLFQWKSLLQYTL